MRPASSAGASPGRRSRTPSEARRGSRRLRHAWQTVGAVAVGLGGAALVVFLIVADSRFVASVYERSESTTLLLVVAGAIAAAATVAGVAWYRRWAHRLSVTVRRVLGRTGIAWSVLFVVAFVWTHPMHRDADSAVPLQAGVVTYLLLIVIAGLGFSPIAMLRSARSRRPRPGRRRA